MPTIIPFKFEQRQLQARSVIVKYQELSKLDDESAGMKIRRCKRSFQDKKRKPETFTLGELWEFADSVHMSGPDRAIILGATDIKQIFN